MFALQGGVSGELLSYGGRVMVHDNEAELKFLFPKWKDGQVKVVEVAVQDGRLAHDGRQTMWVGDHPELASVRWPLDPRDFNLRE